MLHQSQMRMVAKFGVHEAWAEIVLANSADTTVKFKPIQNLSLKIGRQELVYDDVRLLGNLDWLQQGRRFDAAIFKAQHLGWALDFGGGFQSKRLTLLAQMALIM